MWRVIAILVAAIIAVLIVGKLLSLLMVAFWFVVAGVLVFGLFQLSRRSRR